MPRIRRLPSLTQLRHLAAVAEHGHFGRAAEACFVTQSSLSASIKELETLLGKVLIERTRRSVMVTPLGETVAARACRLECVERREGVTKMQKSRWAWGKAGDNHGAELYPCAAGTIVVATASRFLPQKARQNKNFGERCDSV